MSLKDMTYCNVNYHNAPIAEYDPNSPPPNADFLIDIFAILTHVPFNVMEGGEDPGMLNEEYTSQHFHKLIETQSDLLLREDAFHIANMLSEVNVPEDFHEFCISRISMAARMIVAGAAAKQKASTGPLTMSVHVGVVIFEEPEEDYDDDVDDEGELGADNTAVEALEKVVFKEGEVLHECSICLDVIGVGSEGTRMPCSHFFHRCCIVCWLENSKQCPNCRFQI